MRDQHDNLKHEVSKPLHPSLEKNQNSLQTIPQKQDVMESTQVISEQTTLEVTVQRAIHNMEHNTRSDMGLMQKIIHKYEVDKLEAQYFKDIIQQELQVTKDILMQQLDQEAAIAKKEIWKSHRAADHEITLEIYEMDEETASDIAKHQIEYRIKAYTDYKAVIDMLTMRHKSGELDQATFEQETCLADTQRQDRLNRIDQKTQQIMELYRSRLKQALQTSLTQ